MWPELIRKSKEGGLDIIETYVFWNYHEPVQGQVLGDLRFCTFTTPDFNLFGQSSHLVDCPCA